MALPGRAATCANTLLVMAFLLAFLSDHDGSGGRGSPGKGLCGRRARRRSRAVDPGRAVSQAVRDPIFAGIDRRAGHEIGDEQLLWTAAPLLLGREHPVPPFADPAAIDRRRMQAGPAIPLSRPVAMAVV